MFRFDPHLKVCLHREVVDGRKNINGFALLVEQGLRQDPFDPTLFVFGNQRRDRLRILLWDRNGFWLMTKRLEADRFTWSNEAETLAPEGTPVADEAEPNDIEVAGHVRKKRGRKPLDPNLPRDIVRHELPESEHLLKPLPTTAKKRGLSWSPSRRLGG